MAVSFQTVAVSRSHPGWIAWGLSATLLKATSCCRLVFGLSPQTRMRAGFADFGDKSGDKSAGAAFGVQIGHVAAGLGVHAGPLAELLIE